MRTSGAYRVASDWLHSRTLRFKRRRLAYVNQPLLNQMLILKAGDRTRTCDRLITNQQLYQLSYTSAPGQLIIITSSRQT